MDPVTVTEGRLSAEHRSALAMLATAGRNGLTKQFLVVCTSDAGIVDALVNEGFAELTCEEVQAGTKMIKVARIRITAAGRRAIEE